MYDLYLPSSKDSSQGFGESDHQTASSCQHLQGLPAWQRAHPEHLLPGQQHPLTERWGPKARSYLPCPGHSNSLNCARAPVAHRRFIKLHHTLAPLLPSPTSSLLSQMLIPNKHCTSSKRKGMRKIWKMRTLQSDRKPNMFEIKIWIPDAQTNLFSACKSESYRFPLMFISLNLKEEEIYVAFCLVLLFPSWISLKDHIKLMRCWLSLITEVFDKVWHAKQRKSEVSYLKTKNCKFN